MTFTPMINHEDFMLRDARASDIDDIYHLSAFLNTVNLPANIKELESVIANSERSFSLEEKDATKRAFLFVLTEKNGRVIGTSQVFAKHGTLTSPHLYFQVDHDEKYSETLKKYFRHRTLRLCQSFDGPCEVGSLVLDKNFRGSNAKLGRSLSYVRFIFMAMRRDLFSHQVIAELLPPLGPNFQSPLWEAIGRKFTGLDYYEADMISRSNKEFIKTLFPTCEIYCSLLPESAQEVIGQVGRYSKGAAHLLSKIGFTYSHRVDPFDGGPHFEAEQDDITLIQQTTHGRAKKSENELRSHGLVARFNAKAESGERFCAVLTAFQHEACGAISLSPRAVNAMSLCDDDAVSAVELPHRA